MRQANSAKHAFEIAAAAKIDIAAIVAEAGWKTAAKALRGADTALETIIFDRDGALLARSGLHGVGVK